MTDQVVVSGVDLGEATAGMEGTLADGIEAVLHKRGV